MTSRRTPKDALGKPRGSTESWLGNTRLATDSVAQQTKK
jgi:hypothetical protein